MAKDELNEDESVRSIRFLEWSIQARHTVQSQALDLVRLMEEKGSEATSQQKRQMRRLAGVAFALWRAAFLANRTTKLDPSFEASKTFLKKVLDDNTITFTFDFLNRDWTFRFYADAATFNLSKLPEALQSKAKQFTTSTEEWDNLLEAYTFALEQLKASLVKKPTGTKKKKA